MLNIEHNGDQKTSNIVQYKTNLYYKRANILDKYMYRCKQRTILNWGISAKMVDISMFI